MADRKRPETFADAVADLHEAVADLRRAIRRNLVSLIIFLAFVWLLVLIVVVAWS